ncbi:bifunctional folylpolyglutamate synthase/dihydrofolate synthase [Desulfobacca acetoxidans]|uniref:Dihydrofolate synthase/folylpolyglutamate synthase n=1 Tax=Desulfobacca acetoxidans (strain ATCC 700848 / DSM 11109 / ASRB2) TaxID=880072 RepID=F2NH51_DESAR|nr:folylpolyglutamate synthase/dihydrofolate synthase family protein [Desulfobacca acetoxidans]AEB08893.1 FolC bifunctional protein [Desulfobacca acetoxidans DSM 11109]
MPKTREPTASLPQSFDSLSTALKWVYDLQKFGIKFGLSSTTRLLTGLNNPQEKCRYIHIAGTNGKGSVAAMLSAIFTQAGYRIGFYSSPHLISFHERFRLQDQDITDDEVLELINQVRQVVQDIELPTFFEFVTAMAFLYYSQKAADPVILETGMGGRLDATNIIQPLLTIITNIAMDHREFLGNDLRAIAAEKAGIIKPGVPVVTYVSQASARLPIQAASGVLKSPLYYGGSDFQVKGQGNGRFRYQGRHLTLSGLQTNLVGRHQYRNAAVALAAVELLQEQGFHLPEESIRQGLQQVRWPGRLEVVSTRPQIILDGAHNPAAATTLMQALKHDLIYRRLILVLGIMADKDIRGILRRLLPLAQVVIFSRPRYERAATPEKLKSLAANAPRETYVIDDLAAAIAQARRLADQDDLIVVTGSLFTIGEARQYL